ncbi:hypothetical protein H6P81_000161 [Aristolochia fimbriata]|uniref:Importin subunit alpha n=1 Tax=Aristolochia fimbriata TaxID=158543 RepID=A0AAV7F3R4_ARIFI|nr:hypothetical protein H6P81_000161 [Aristolochia fimbriata]
MSLRPDARTEVRRNRYKVAVDAEEGRRRRDDTAVAIRKIRREESLQKKRREGVSQYLTPPFDPSGVDNGLGGLPDMLKCLWSDDCKLQLEAVTKFREVLSRPSPPVEQIVEAGVVPRFVELLIFREDWPQIQFEVAWAICNIASGASEYSRIVVDHGAVPALVKLLTSRSDSIREQAAWALGNIVGDCPKYRDLVLGHGALLPVLALLNERASLSMIRTAVWVISNFCRGQPGPPFEQMTPIIPVLGTLIQSSDDEQVLEDAGYALSFLSDKSIEAFVQTGICARLVHLLQHPSPTVVLPALHAVGNIATGDDSQTQCLLDNEALPWLLRLLILNYDRNIKREACWTISNITAGNLVQIQAVINAGMIPPLVNLLRTADFTVKKEAAWAISNLTSRGVHDQIKYVASQGCIKPLCDLLLCADARTVIVCLIALENILMVGEAEMDMGLTGSVNLYAEMIHEADGLEKIESLQTHDNSEVYKIAVRILETYWPLGDEHT